MSAARASRKKLRGLPARPERVAIEAISPNVDGARFPIKRTVGDVVTVEADCFADGHDHLTCLLQYRHDGEQDWQEVVMEELGNDRWRASFSVDQLGCWRYAIVARIDEIRSWSSDISRRNDSADLLLAARIGSDLLDATVERMPHGDVRTSIQTWARELRHAPAERVKSVADNPALLQLAIGHADRHNDVRSAVECRVIVDRTRARFSSWYEMFPRSAADSLRHGTFEDVIRRLDYVASLGFDVLYLPPIHPIGTTYRKGKNNATSAAPGDVGSPWAIGSDEGGHTAIHSQLGTIDDFRRLLQCASAKGLEIALDIAIQVTPDHPYVKAHPLWFRHRPDGSIQYAENPPKKYQDIYPLNFESEDWKELWAELRAVFHFWIREGVRIFRVDNPHTKPFQFWEWLIADIKRDYPDVLFLAEAFTRPKVMHRLAKVGFTQSYTYFTWRNDKRELTEYFTELCQSSTREYFLPNCWPNTPDILAKSLQHQGRPGFTLRLLLAATFAANYGIYGPSFELMENEPIAAGSEEYLNSEKYELRHWNLEDPRSLAKFITQVNQIRRGSPALQSDWSLRFHVVDNDQLICYSKNDDGNIIVVVANLDLINPQSGWVELKLDAFNVPDEQPYEVYDLLAETAYQWHGRRNYVRLDPHVTPAHVFRLMLDQSTVQEPPRTST